MSKKHMGSSLDDFLKQRASSKRRKRRRSKRLSRGSSPRP